MLMQYPLCRRYQNDEPLYAKLRPGMRVTIAIDDLSMPLPPETPDVREIIDIVLELLDGMLWISAYHATAFHRPDKEIKVWEAKPSIDFGHFYNHDANAPVVLPILKNQR